MDSPVRDSKPFSDDERGKVDLFGDSEYRRLIAVRDAAEAKWHQAVINRHRAYQFETQAATEKSRASTNLDKYLREKRLDN